MIEPRAAETLIGEHLACLPIESLPVGQCAGAVLRENIYAERDQPPFDRVSMDGIAVHSSSGIQQFRVQATQGAGAPPLTLAAPDQCIEVMTGAVLPLGCDVVIPVEQVVIKDGIASIESAALLTAGKHIHRRASDQHQGALLLATGTVLHAQISFHNPSI